MICTFDDDSGTSAVIRIDQLYKDNKLFSTSFLLGNLSEIKFNLIKSIIKKHFNQVELQVICRHRSSTIAFFGDHSLIDCMRELYQYRCVSEQLLKKVEEQKMSDVLIIGCDAASIKALERQTKTLFQPSASTEQVQGPIQVRRRHSSSS